MVLLRNPFPTALAEHVIIKDHDGTRIANVPDRLKAMKNWSWACRYRFMVGNVVQRQRLACDLPVHLRSALPTMNHSKCLFLHRRSIPQNFALSVTARAENLKIAFGDIYKTTVMDIAPLSHVTFRSSKFAQESW